MGLKLILQDQESRALPNEPAKCPKNSCCKEKQQNATKFYVCLVFFKMELIVSFLYVTGDNPIEKGKFI